MNRYSKKILCILPAFNEENKIGNVVRRILDTGIINQIIVVNDGSTDNTYNEALLAGAYVINNRINLGVGAAIRKGIQYGIKNNYDIGVIMGGDGQHESKELESIIAPLIYDNAQFVQGSRYTNGGSTINPPFFRDLLTRIYSIMFTFLSGNIVTDGSNGFRSFYLSIFKKYKINLNKSWLNSYQLEPYLLYKVTVMKNIKVVEVPITIYYQENVHEYSKMRPIYDWWNLLKPLIFLRIGIWT